MKVCDVAADGDVSGEGNFRLVRGTEKRVIAMLWSTREQRTADGLAEADLIFGAVTCGGVQQLARFFRAAERAF